MANSKIPKAKSKIDLLVEQLRRPTGASIDELAKVTGWQAHSVRGAMAGTIRKKGHILTSTKEDGTRRYRLAESANE